jgi:hypothetical protein
MDHQEDLEADSTGSIEKVKLATINHQQSAFKPSAYFQPSAGLVNYNHTQGFALGYGHGYIQSYCTNT